ncbi:MAG: hypothetical protein HOU81_11550 [Hamadaea sp.]|uniref:hypothetical protein n=1 Tax=Hamadaea sp. TaxID=2024425 RepID=UPI00180AB7E6|nr:hypothetical protein [Hamadaea sp.]NUR71447.1 hypothetical protein [Hamadaea sp.]NUT23757.1 hypothetical protein [Hamadaea sp.]
MRLKEWFVRYAPPELAGIAGALAVAGWFGKPALGALGETVAFYTVVFARDHRAPRRVRHTLRDMVFEFGPAELIDSAAVRPLAMYAGTILLGGMVVGITVGKIAADVVFYALAIAGYEVRKRRSAGHGPDELGADGTGQQPS